MSAPSASWENTLLRVKELPTLNNVYLYLTPCFYRVIATLVKVWENSKKSWKHSPAARVPTAFLVLPNFHSCFYNSIETRYMFSIS